MNKNYLKVLTGLTLGALLFAPMFSISAHAETEGTGDSVNEAERSSTSFDDNDSDNDANGSSTDDTRDRVGATSKVEERTDRLNNRAGQVEDKANKVADKLASRDEKRSQMIATFTTHASEVLSNIVDKMGSLSGKVEDRINQIEDVKGVDLSDARAQLDTAKADLVEAQNKVEALGGAVDEILNNSSTTRIAFDETRTVIAEARDSIRTAHQHLVDAIQLIKVALGLTDEKGQGNNN